MLPFTESREVGDAVPIPTFPLVATKILEVAVRVVPVPA
jgi:hypothetical protein